MTPSSDTLRALQERLGYAFRDPRLLEDALTHASYLQEHPEAGRHNQRLEFLGDSVLHLVLSDAVFREYPEEREGVLSRHRAGLTRGDFLTALALDLGIDAGLRLARSEEDTGGRTRPSILEDALEAVVGAIYLDSDFPTARDVVLRWYGPLSERLARTEGTANPKGRLQELIQPRHGNNALRYEVLSATGPKHACQYEVVVHLLGEPIGFGRGSSKKIAEEEAARAGLATLQARGAAG